MSIMGGLTAEAYDRTYSDRALIQRMRGYFRPQQWLILGVGTMILIQSLADIGTPLLISRGITLFTTNPSLIALLTLMGAALLIGTLSWVSNYVRQIYATRAVNAVVLHLRHDAFRAAMRQDLGFYDQHPSGKVASRVIGDTDSFASTINLTITLLSQVLLVVLMSIVLMVINWRLTLLTLLVIPVIVVAVLIYRRFARFHMRRASRTMANINNIIQETISGIAIAKNFRQEQAIYDDFNAINSQSYRVLLVSNLSVNTIFSVLDIIGGMGLALVLYSGGVQVVGQTLTLGEWFLFVQSLGMFLSPVANVAAFWSQLQQGLAASERIFALLDSDTAVRQTDQQPVSELRGQIEFRHVQFSYREGELVLPDLALSIPVGQTVALVGHTGAGKSSVAKLLMRFYEFQGGSILVDQRDIRSLDLHQYRRQIGFVPQVPVLFSGTVADNIRYGQPDATLEAVERVARQIGGGAWLESLPKGLATQVGERGNRLSMGQRHVVAIARLLLQNPAICILDEATASVDLFTEARIQEGIALALRGRTSIVIAHRLSTVRNADRILVLEKGRIIEDGTHTSLLAQQGHYADLYNTYFRHQALDYADQLRLKVSTAV